MAPQEVLHPYGSLSQQSKQPKKKKKDGPKGLGEGNSRPVEHTVNPSQPGSPPKETVGPGDNKCLSAPKVLTEVKGTQHFFSFHLNSEVAHKTQQKSEDFYWLGTHLSPYNRI